MTAPDAKPCDEDYRRCKGKCFDMLVDGLASAGEDQGQMKAARDRYLKCRATCKAALEICAQLEV